MLDESEKRETKMALDLSALESEVSENTAVIGSAVALLAGLKVRIEELIAGMVTEEDKAKLQAFASELDAASNSLAAAVAENTPSA
jgi:ATP phosphoribosyltransferase regulatory subunit HisZ